MQIKRSIKIGLFILIGGFVLLFLLRFGYGFIEYPSDGSSPSPYSQYSDSGFSFNNFILSSRNIASHRLKSFEKGYGKDYGKGYEKGMSSVSPNMPAGGMPQGTSVDQKYEKIGSLASKTNEFDADHQKVRATIEEYKGLIQFEQNTGLKGARVLQLGVGIAPEVFDEAIEKFKSIGKLVAIQIDKTDKTSEYINLRAKRLALEKTRDALVALKSRGGRIDELMALEGRILQTEQEIQTFGVQLGEFDQENEFCTVKLSLIEQKEAVKKSISIAHRLKVAFEWTVKYYLALVGNLFLGFLTVLIIVLLLEKLRWIPTATEVFLKSKD